VEQIIDSGLENSTGILGEAMLCMEAKYGNAPVTEIMHMAGLISLMVLM